MTSSIKIGSLEICELCKSGKKYEFDFKRRCCQARHMLTMPKVLRQKKYQEMDAKKGRAFTEQFISDVQAMYTLRQSERGPS